MAETPGHAPGTFCWVELGTSDQQAARSFYMELFGWEAEDVPMGEESTYTMFHKGGRYTAAAYQVDPNQPVAMPNVWGVYISTSDVDSAVAKVSDLGGTVLAEPFDVFDSGRMAVVQDPTGAVFMLWQAKEHHGVGVKSEHGALCWNELLTRDASAAQDFYGGLLGWTTVVQEMPAPTGLYTTFMAGEQPSGGMMTIQADWGDVPPHWGTYFWVDDCDACVARAEELGGGVYLPPMEIPGVGRFAGLTDPQGAMFSIIQGEEMEAT